MLTNEEVFETKERAADRVGLDMRQELEKEIITPDHDDAGYELFHTRFTLFH